MEKDSTEYIASITTDVLKILSQKDFFAKLDDQLSPTSDVERRKTCAHDYAISETILRAANFSLDDLGDIFDVLRAQGGFCDCEILYNAAPPNRLKSNYWCQQAAKVTDPNGEAPPSDK